jgi:hypothetical protein
VAETEVELQRFEAKFQREKGVEIVGFLGKFSEIVLKSIQNFFWHVDLRQIQISSGAYFKKKKFRPIFSTFVVHFNASSRVVVGTYHAKSQRYFNQFLR